MRVSTKKAQGRDEVRRKRDDQVHQRSAQTRRPKGNVAGESGASKTTTGGDGSSRRRTLTGVKRRRWPRRVALVLIVLVLGMAAAFSWDRWLRYDDAYDIQGEWQVDGSTKIIVIDGTAIKLTDEVAYTYTLDPTAKTISFTFGTRSGAGRYCFSADRSQLIIMDGDSYSAVSTLSEDVAWAWDTLVRIIQGHEPVYPTGEGVTVFERVSRDASAAPSEGTSLPTSSQGVAESDEGSSQEGTSDATDESGTVGQSEDVDGDASSEAVPESTWSEAGTGGGDEGSSAESDAPSALFDVSDAAGA